MQYQVYNNGIIAGGVGVSTGNVNFGATGANIDGNVIVDKTAKIDDSALVGPNVVIGPGVTVGAGCRISNSTLLEGSKMDNYSFMDGSILGWKSSVGKWCRVTGLTVIAEDVQVKD